MALSRLRESIKELFVHYLDDDGVSRRDPDKSTGERETTATGSAMSRWTGGEKKIGMHKNSLTLFVPDPYVEDCAADVLDEVGCFDFRKEHSDLYVYPGFALKAGLSDFEVLAIAASIEDKNANSDFDAERYHRLKDSVHLNSQVDMVCAEMQKRCLQGAQAFLLAFLATFLEQYAKPYLINKGMYHVYAKMLAEGVKDAATVCLADSMTSAVFSMVTRNAIWTTLKLLNFDAKTIENWSDNAAATVAVMQDPLNLIEFGVSGLGVEAGERAAYQFIYQLPKLKIEPEIEEGIKEGIEPQQKKVEQESPITVRRRMVYG